MIDALVLHDTFIAFNINRATLVVNEEETWCYVRLSNSEFQLYLMDDKPTHYIVRESSKNRKEAILKLSLYDLFKEGKIDRYLINCIGSPHGDSPALLTIADLSRCTALDLMKRRGFGRVCLRKVDTLLKGFGFTTIHKGDEISSWTWPT